MYGDPGFGGLLSVLEAGEYPCPEAWAFPQPFIGSLKTLKMVLDHYVFLNYIFKNTVPLLYILLFYLHDAKGLCGFPSLTGWDKGGAS